MSASDSDPKRTELRHDNFIVVPRPGTDPSPSNWNEMKELLIKTALAIPVESLRLVLDLIKGGRSFVRGLADLPDAAASRVRRPELPRPSPDAPKPSAEALEAALARLAAELKREGVTLEIENRDSHSLQINVVRTAEIAQGAQHQEVEHTELRALPPPKAPQGPASS